MSQITFKQSRSSGVFFFIISTILLGVSSSLYSQGESRIRIGLSSLVNAETGFGHLNRSTTINDPAFQNTNQGVNRIYDDGFVGVDSTGNDSGMTWNWGVNSSSPTLINNSIAFHKNAFSSEAQQSDDSPGSLGVNMTWVSKPRALSNSDTWSLLANVDFIRLNSEENHVGNASVTQIQDLYDHSAFDPSLVSFPHQGSVEGPGPLLSDLPVRSENTIANGADYISRMNLEGRLLMLGIGGEYQHKVKDKLTLLLQIRYMFGWFTGDFEYNDHFLLNDTVYAPESGNKDVSKNLNGTSVGVGITYEIDEKSSIFFTTNRWFLDRVDGEVDNRSYYLDLDSGVLISVGYQGLF